MGVGDVRSLCCFLFMASVIDSTKAVARVAKGGVLTLSRRLFLCMHSREFETQLVPPTILVRFIHFHDKHPLKYTGPSS